MFMPPVGVQAFVAGSYSSALEVCAPPPATRTRPSWRRTAPCSQRGTFSVPPGSQVPVGGSYSSVVDSPTPPTTRTRPFPSGVAVMLERATDMLAVAVQLPAAVLTELEPAASAGAESASTAQITNLTRTKPPARLH